MMQSSPCPAPADADDPPEPLELPAVAVDPFELLAVAVARLELLFVSAERAVLPAVVDDEPDTPLPDRTVTDEPPGRLVEPESPPGPVVTVLEGMVPEESHCTTRQSVLLRSPGFAPSMAVPVLTLEFFDPVPPLVTVDEPVDEPLAAVAQGSVNCRPASAANADDAMVETAKALPNASVRQEDKNARVMMFRLSIGPPDFTGGPLTSIRARAEIS